MSATIGALTLTAAVLAFTGYRRIEAQTSVKGVTALCGSLALTALTVFAGGVAGKIIAWVLA